MARRPSGRPATAAAAPAASAQSTTAAAPAAAAGPVPGQPTWPAPAINMALLKSVVEATANGGFLYVMPADAAPLGDMIEQNSGMADERGALATRATQKGVTAAAQPNGPAPAAQVAAAPARTAPAAAPAPKPVFKIRTGLVPPPKKVFGEGRGREERYPFSTLNINEGFHVPKTDKAPDPARTLQSTVSSANARFAVEKKNPDGSVMMENKVVSLGKRDERGELIKGADGKIIRERVTESRPVLEYTKRFTVYPVGADDPDGEGAVIMRTA